MAVSEPSTEQRVSFLGRYVLFDELARGGMATVHLGRLRGAAGFSKTVAIKKMHANVAGDPRFLAMFLDEARLASRIQHPNVVPVFDVIAERDEAYLVMEYVDGESLSTLRRTLSRRGERIPVPIAAHIVCNALYGLHAAHEATNEQGEPLKLVHRDISPQNILVGVDGVARVLDFGIAKAVGRVQETESGEVKGKIAYMAPEQIKGEPLDRRADIFSTGVVLWELLAGQRLFGGKTSAESMYRVLEAIIPPLSDFLEDLPQALVDAVARATSKRPEDRFGSALEFAAELERSVTLIPNHVVGRWVIGVGGESLTARRELLRTIEALQLPADATGSFALQLSARELTVPHVRAGPDETTRAGAPMTVAAPPERVTRPVWTAAAFGLALLGIVAVWWRSPRAPELSPNKAPEAAAQPVASASLQLEGSAVASAPSAAVTVPSASAAAATVKPPPSGTARGSVASPKRVVAKPAPRRPPVLRPEKFFSRE
jgi:serine/threonine protein kinase